LYANHLSIMNRFRLKSYTFFLLCGFYFLLFFKANSQDISIEIGDTEIGLNEMFSITATVQNDRIKECSGFPDIGGFAKVGTSSAQNTTIINGKVSSAYSLTQNYKASKVGTYSLKPFQMQVNGKTVQGQAAAIKVVQQTARQQNDPFADFFGFMREESGSNSFVDVKEDAFFSVNANKSEVYVGEGFNIAVAMYIADANRAFLEFHEIGEQLGEILKKIKPTSCWEENFGIEEITPEVVTINGKTYRQYKIYQANFYPLNTESVLIPSVDFKMIKFKVAANPSFFGNNHVKDLINFKSKERKIAVKPLPNHPLKDQVAVGNFKLQEALSKADVKTGESFNYKFQLVGEGNLSALKPPTLPQTTNFVFYPPNERLQINRSDNTVYGSKQFNYLVAANEAGNYRLADYFQWIYFNTQTAKYDTLRSRMTLRATGASVNNGNIDNENAGGFYELIADSSNGLKDIEESFALRMFTNLVVLIILSLLAYQIFKQRRTLQTQFNKNFLLFRKKRT
jgi:hypothetical protein